MGLSEKQDLGRQRRNSEQQEREAPRPREAASGSSATRLALNDADKPRIWVLPGAHGEFLVVAAQPDVRKLAEDLRQSPPALQAAAAETGVAARAWKKVEPRLVEQMHESIFDFARRMMVSVAWLASAFALTRIEGEFEEAGLVLGLLGLGFLAYTVVRYGYRVVRWHNRRVDASHAFAQSVVQENPLARRLAAALELRSKLKPEDRGKSPDDELLDTNAYRKLIADGTTTLAELTTLGEAVNAALKFQDNAGNARKLADVAKDAGISAETAIFYRDLAAAASDIKLTMGME